MDDLERAARAIYESDFEVDAVEDPWRDTSRHPGTWDPWVRQARAALESLMEPSKEVIEVGNTVSEDAGDIWEPSHGIDYNGPSCGLEVWQAMLRHILEQGE